MSAGMSIVILSRGATLCTLSSELLTCYCCGIFSDSMIYIFGFLDSLYFWGNGWDIHL